MEAKFYKSSRIARVNQRTFERKDADLLVSRQEDRFFDRKAFGVSGKTVQKIAPGVGLGIGNDSSDIIEVWRALRYEGWTTLSRLGCGFVPPLTDGRWRRRYGRFLGIICRRTLGAEEISRRPSALALRPSVE